MPKELFGTDGIRGVLEHPADDGTLYATGRSLGNYLKETSRQLGCWSEWTRASLGHTLRRAGCSLGQSG